jgi:hypothetical protein
MNFQEKMFDATSDLRARAGEFATAVLARAKFRAGVAAKRVKALQGSLETLSGVSREFNKVARTHSRRFVKENSALALDAGKDVSKLARATFATLLRKAPVTKARKARTSSRKRAAKAA